MLAVPNDRECSGRDSTERFSADVCHNFQFGDEYDSAMWNYVRHDRLYGASFSNSVSDGVMKHPMLFPLVDYDLLEVASHNYVSR